MPSADEVLIAAIGLVLTGAELREAGRLAERASAGDGFAGRGSRLLGHGRPRGDFPGTGHESRAGLLSFSPVLPACCECKLIFYMTSRAGCGDGLAVERRSGE